MVEHRPITGANIHFDSTLTWYVSSPVERFLSHFADTLLTEGRLSIGQHQLRVRDVKVTAVLRPTASSGFTLNTLKLGTFKPSVKSVKSAIQTINID